MRTVVGIFTIVGLCVSTQASAQASTSLQGTWTTPQELVGKAPLPELGKVGAGAKGASAIKLTVNADSVHWTGLGVTYKYALDGSETTNCARSLGVCQPDSCRAHRAADTLVMSCRAMLREGAHEVITYQRAWIDANGNLQLDGRLTFSGVTTALRSTYVRQGRIIFDLESGNAIGNRR